MLQAQGRVAGKQLPRVGLGYWVMTSPGQVFFWEETLQSTEPSSVLGGQQQLAVLHEAASWFCLI